MPPTHQRLSYRPTLYPWRWKLRPLWLRSRYTWRLHMNPHNYYFSTLKINQTYSWCDFAFHSSPISTHVLLFLGNLAYRLLKFNLENNIHGSENKIRLYSFSDTCVTHQGKKLEIHSCIFNKFWPVYFQCLDRFDWSLMKECTWKATPKRCSMR